MCLTLTNSLYCWRSIAATRPVLFHGQRWVGRLRSSIKKWVKPSKRWIKGNFDGAWEERLKNGGFGVILHNSDGGFLVTVAG